MEKKKRPRMIKITKTEIIILIVVYLFALFLWTLPFQDQSIPYGEGDASINFFLSNHMFSTDKPMVYVPNATSVLGISSQSEDYAKVNPNNYLFYAPQFHTNFAVMQIIGNNAIIGFYLYLAIICSSIFFTVYFLMRGLYGPITGLLSGFLMIFSVRDQLSYIWGQWGTAFTFLFIPLVLYTYYKYSSSVIEKKEKPIYAYILALLLVFQFLFHPLGFFIGGGMIAVYTVLLAIKEKTIPFNYKKVLICVLIFMVLVPLFEPLMIKQLSGRLDIDINSMQEDTTEKAGFFARLFGWYNIPGGGHGVPDFYFSFKNIYYGYWMLPFLLIGIAYLALNRTNKDLLILSTLIGFYIITHLDLVGILLGGKYPRIFYFESIMFYPIIALGVTKLTSFIKFKGNVILKYAIIAGFVIAVLMINVKTSYPFFNTAYDGIGRLNDVEMQGAAWINENIPKNSYIMLVGAPTFKQQAWLQAMIPEKVIVFDENQIVPSKDKDLNKTTYLIMDYSFFYLYNDQQGIAALAALEQNMTKEDNLKYNIKEQFKVFKLG